MRRFGTFGVCLVIGALAAAGSAEADGVMRDGLGAISSGRGGTNLGHFDNGAVLHDNPAGMVHVPGRGLNEFSIDTLFPDIRYGDRENRSVHADRDPYPLPYLSLIRKSDDGLWAYGLGIFAPAGFGTEYDLINTTVDPTIDRHHYKSFASLMKILPGLSCKLTDRLSVGGTLGLAVSHAEIEAPFTLQTGPAAGLATVMDLQGTGATTTGSIGLQYRLGQRTTVGATYTTESRLDLDGSATVDIFGLGHSRYRLAMDWIWPQSAGVGIRHELGRSQTFSADAIWYDWSSAFDHLDLAMHSSAGPTVRDRIPLEWRDSVSLRLGYEQQLTCCSTLRTGYVYHRNPVPDDTLTPLIPAILEHAVSAGYGRRWGGMRFDVGYQYSFGSRRSVDSSDILGGDFDDSHVRVAAQWLFLSFQQSF